MLVAMLAAMVVVTLVAMLVEVVELFLLAFNLNLKKTTTTTQIDDLPDVILVEILARLPCKKMRFLSLQGVGEENTFIGAGIVAVLPYPKNKLRPKLEVLAHPVVKTKGSHFSLDFLPCFQEEKEREVRLLVAGTYNDLVLCCKTYQDEEYYNIYDSYYICNPYTKQWVVLPPNHLRVPQDCSTCVGFICEPYVNYSADGKEEQTSSITLNADYRWSVVQMVIPHMSTTLELHMEILSSETRGNNNIVELDPTFSSDVIDQCRFGIGTRREFMCLGVCRGRLRMCQKDFRSVVLDYRHLNVWEWKEEVDDNGCKVQKWCLIVDRLSMNQLHLKYPLISEKKLRKRRRFQVLSFHPNNGDVVFLETEYPKCIALCNMSEKKTLEIVSEFDPAINLKYFSSWFGSSYLGSTNVYPFVIPWLPTPVPKS
ncbi:hypothetical protein M0R45_017442 [Rubus argutus]|uniref:Uncharacterized protein n=1 Tax=Rubus argutus TaxID=59490 RepID=A0AAW1XV09_RUBAR